MSSPGRRLAQTRWSLGPGSPRNSPQLFGSRHDQRVQGVDGLRTGPVRRGPRHPESSDHLHGGIACLGDPRGLTRKDRQRGGLGICRIGLASESPRLAIGSDHLDHDLAVGAEMTRQPHPVTPGALHAEGPDLT